MEASPSHARWLRLSWGHGFRWDVAMWTTAASALASTPSGAHQRMTAAAATHTGVLANLVPLSRLGSGTSWVPDASPMFAYHAQLGAWRSMVHGNTFLGGNVQGSPRGGRQLSVLSWFMLMAQRELGGGQFEPRLMISLEPLTLGKRGYPLLLQSGETADERSLHDRQHPHDLWMETAFAY